MKTQLLCDGVNATLCRTTQTDGRTSSSSHTQGRRNVLKGGGTGSPQFFSRYISPISIKGGDGGPHHINILVPTKIFDIPTALTHARKAGARAFWCQ